EKDKTKKLIGIFAVIQFLIYTLIPYKTPWCIIEIIWPFFLCAAFALEKGKKENIAACCFVILALIISVRLNFFQFTDQKEPYVYIQTFEEFSDVMDYVV